MSWNSKAVVLDEAQNCSIREIVTVLTRIGKFSRAFILADPMQSDLKNGQRGACLRSNRQLDRGNPKTARIAIDSGLPGGAFHPSLAGNSGCSQRNRKVSPGNQKSRRYKDIFSWSFYQWYRLHPNRIQHALSTGWNDFLYPLTGNSGAGDGYRRA